MNLALAAEKARLLPQAIFEAVSRLYPILTDLKNLKDKRTECWRFSFLAAIASLFITARWEASFLWPILEKLDTPQDFWPYIYLVLHFALFGLVGFILGRLLYNKKIKEKLNELRKTYTLDPTISLQALAYIEEFDLQNFFSKKEFTQLSQRSLPPI